MSAAPAGQTPAPPAPAPLPAPDTEALSQLVFRRVRVGIYIDTTLDEPLRNFLGITSDADKKTANKSKNVDLYDFYVYLFDIARDEATWRSMKEDARLPLILHRERLNKLQVPSTHRKRKSRLASLSPFQACEMTPLAFFVDLFQSIGFPDKWVLYPLGGPDDAASAIDVNRLLQESAADRQSMPCSLAHFLRGYCQQDDASGPDVEVKFRLHVPKSALPPGGITAVIYWFIKNHFARTVHVKRPGEPIGAFERQDKGNVSCTVDGLASCYEQAHLIPQYFTLPDYQFLLEQVRSCFQQAVDSPDRPDRVRRFFLTISRAADGLFTEPEPDSEEAGNDNSGANDVDAPADGHRHGSDPSGGGTEGTETPTATAGLAPHPAAKKVPQSTFDNNGLRLQPHLHRAFDRDGFYISPFDMRPIFVTADPLPAEICIAEAGPTSAYSKLKSELDADSQRLPSLSTNTSHTIVKQLGTERLRQGILNLAGQVVAAQDEARETEPRSSNPPSPTKRTRTGQDGGPGGDGNGGDDGGRDGAGSSNKSARLGSFAGPAASGGGRDAADAPHGASSLAKVPLGEEPPQQLQSGALQLLPSGIHLGAPAVSKGDGSSVLQPVASSEGARQAQMPSVCAVDMRQRLDSSGSEGSTLFYGSSLDSKSSGSTALTAHSAGTDSSNPSKKAGSNAGSNSSSRCVSLGSSQGQGTLTPAQLAQARVRAYAESWARTGGSASRTSGTLQRAATADVAALASALRLKDPHTIGTEPRQVFEELRQLATSKRTTQAAVFKQAVLDATGVPGQDRATADGEQAVAHLKVLLGCPTEAEEDPEASSEEDDEPVFNDAVRLEGLKHGIAALVEADAPSTTKGRRETFGPEVFADLYPAYFDDAFWSAWPLFVGKNTEQLAKTGDDAASSSQG